MRRLLLIGVAWPLLWPSAWPLAGPQPRAQKDGSSPVSDPASAVFEGGHRPLPPEVADRMRDVSWREGCPVALADLHYLQLRHWGYDGGVHSGELVVHRDVAAEVVDIFRELFEARFPIERMQLVEAYGGDDDASMEANNTSGFNCRPNASDARVFSPHALGRAIDVNPRHNPYVRRGVVKPPSGQPFVDRRPQPGRAAAGMIHEGDACHLAFTRRGWVWGGGWRSLRDYQHFEKR